MDGTAIFVIYQLANTLINWGLLREPVKKPILHDFPLVSVLIPARNEEKTIADCLASVLNQDYPSFEVVVLNDASTDSTTFKIASFGDPRLKVIESFQPVPEDWTGKNWACHRLYLASTGDILLFIDADTQLQPHAISRMISELTSRKLDFISGTPRERLLTLGEKVLVPFMSYSMLTIFPLLLSQLSKHLYMFMVANGQFMMFRRSAYETIGGHEAVKSEVLEDIQLSKLARKKGLRTALYNLRDIITCRMYDGFWNAFFGLAKGYFAIFEMRLIPSLFVWWWMGYLAVHPFALLLVPSTAARTDAIIAIAGNFALWIATAIKTGLPWDVPLYYPIIHVLNSAIGYLSTFLTLAGKVTWKGRRLLPRKVKLL